jgi:hypothetical protein
MKYDITDAPVTPLWGTFATDKWDDRYARNALLHFIHKEKLDSKCLKWIDKNFPSDRED